MRKRLLLLLTANWLFYGFGAALVALGSLNLFNGLADNMDFNRSTSFLFSRAAGFSA
ncbi:hypothetical protein [Paraburkholderia sp. GAS348]|uniref:hypothetical protein n=1 Tax=Paraburkholderia sp. GAS348 TaxID=3035132 RepID=UPI003D1ED941